MATNKASLLSKYNLTKAGPLSYYSLAVAAAVFSVANFGSLDLSIFSDTVTPVPLAEGIIRVPKAAVAADVPRCSIVGNDILKQGGNAVDAAVATAFCLGVMSPASSGIGGGNFMVVRMANGTAKAFNMRETAPKKASPFIFYDKPMEKKRGILSICTPGEVKGLHEAWKMFGKLNWSSLVIPAEQIARKGFEISKHLRHEMEQVKDFIVKDPGLSEVFTDGNGNLKSAGTRISNPNLADTLHAIADEGPEVLYNGRIGDALIRDIEEADRRGESLLTKEDLQEYTVSVTDPLKLGEFMGMEFLGMPPPSSGGVGMMLLLNILSLYETPKPISDPLGLHRFIEAMKHMFAVRTRLGDPEFVDTDQIVADMRSREFAAKLKKSIDDSTTYNSTEHYGGVYSPYFEELSVIDDHGTSHVSVVDSERNAVALTCTINNYFGAVFLSKSTGILLNNEMDDFALPPLEAPGGHKALPNYIEPKKRPISSMSPTIILKDGRLKGVFGGSGGSTIIGGTTQVLLRHFLDKMDPYNSMITPRFYHMLIPNEARYEDSKSAGGTHFLAEANLRGGLASKGHNVTKTDFANKCQIIIHENENVPFRKIVERFLRGDSTPLNDFNRGYGALIAVSDPRKMGIPAGY